MFYFFFFVHSKKEKDISIVHEQNKTKQKNKMKLNISVCDRVYTLRIKQKCTPTKIKEITTPTATCLYVN